MDKRVLRATRVLRLEEGDAVYIEADRSIGTPEALQMASCVREWLLAAGHRDVPVIFLESGMRLARLTSADRAAIEDAGKVYVIGRGR